MKKAALIITLSVMGAGQTAWADEELWPTLKPGEVKTFSGEDAKRWDFALRGAGADRAPDLSLTFFKAPHGRDMVVIAPCCEPGAGGASLFELSNANVRPVPLTVGDPRHGFLAQHHAGRIKVEAGATALQARISFTDCEQGVWSYYYQFDEADRPVLLSVIDTSCAHLGVRELYHSKQIDLGHWWLR